MPLKEVQVTDHCAVPSALVWNVVRDFCDPWHPVIATMTAEYNENHHLIRAFTVHGEQTVYRERLTWFSDSEQTMKYMHLQGIAGVDSYNGQLSVRDASHGGSEITMTATLTAPDPRAEKIATGTSAIFKQAIGRVKELAVSAAIPATDPERGVCESSIKNRIIDSQPQLAVSHAGEPTNTLCLFLHGIGGNRRNWNHQLTALAPYCQTVALDLRGYGDSDLGTAQSTVDDYCADILEVADAFKADKLILCGLSYGAWIATSFAMRYPERIAALVLSGGCTGMSEASSEERDNFRQSREVPLSEGKSPADFAAAVVSVISGPDASAAIRKELLESMQNIPATTYADALRCFTNPQESFDFTNINMPTLLMTGEHDTLAPPAEIRQVAQRIHEASRSPDVRYECLANAGHVCNLEAPQAYNTALIELLKRVC